MVNSKNTKRALLTSALAILACVAMLIGTTFAWFTDTASTSVNKITSGKLDIELQYATAWNDVTGAPTAWVNAEGKVLNFRTADNRTENILWEPGATYQLPELRIVNNGNLALKYKIVINGIAGDAELNKVIDWEYRLYSMEGDRYEYNVGGNLSDGDEITGEMIPGVNGDVTAPIVISGTMDTAAGNEYQGLTIDGIAVTVYATQLNHENDSIGPDYDKEAEYPTAADALKTALENGGNIIMGDDIAVAPVVADKTVSKLAPQMLITKDTTLNLSGKKLGVNAAEDFGKASPVLMAVMGGTLTIDGDGEINCEAGSQQVYGINVNGGKVVVNGGKHYGAITAIQVQKGELEINGGFFDMAPTCKAQVPQYAKYIVNCIDSNFKDGTAKISIKGGTFVNFDPSANPEGAGTTYVADGYKVISETKDNGDVWYTVVDASIKAATQEELKDALENSVEAGKSVKLALGAGEYTLYNVNKAKTTNTSLTLEGAGKDSTVLTAGDMTVTDANGEGSSDYSYENSDVVFKNMTVSVGTGNYKGFVRAKSLYFENCKIVGRGSYWGVGKVVFKDCEFADNAGDYNLWTYAGIDFTFDGCTFNSSAGKFINAYKEKHTDITKLSFTNCKFIAGTENKPAVCIKGWESQAWDVSFNECVLTNCKTDATTGSDYYLFDQGIESETKVTINNTVVWENGAKK